MTAVEKIDWFCPKCNSYVSSESVTFEETHQICNTGVILKELNQNKMTAVEYLINELSDIIGPIEATLSGELLLAGAIKRAKEMEKEEKEPLLNYIKDVRDVCGKHYHPTETELHYLSIRAENILATFKSE